MSPLMLVSPILRGSSTGILSKYDESISIACSVMNMVSIVASILRSSLYGDTTFVLPLNLKELSDVATVMFPCAIPLFMLPLMPNDSSGSPGNSCGSMGLRSSNDICLQLSSPSMPICCRLSLRLLNSMLCDEILLSGSSMRRSVRCAVRSMKS